MTNSTEIRLFGTAPDSIVDGPGLRYSIFVQGCTHHCKGCHNPESWRADGGTSTSLESILDEIRENKLIEGVTLSGGEPFEQASLCAQLAHACKAMGKSVWVYSGYIYEDLVRAAQCSEDDSLANHIGALPAQCWRALDAEGVAALLAQADVLVDGPFKEEMHSYELKWRGSSNQRLIDLAATRRAGKVVLWEPYSFVPKKPANW